MQNSIPFDVFAGWDILVVDDEPHNLELVQYLLEFFGGTVLLAKNGQEALDQVKLKKPRFVICDLSMPVMDGWKFLATILGDTDLADLPVIALTAHAMLGDRERALSAGFRNYIVKPLVAQTFMDELIKVIKGIPELADLRM